jgi:GNAT superfamily N-acetyltransferase
MHAVFLAAIGGLYRRHAFTPPEPPLEAFAAQQRHLLEHDAERCWVYEQNGEVVAYAAAFVRDETWYLSSLFVDPAVQARGVGSRLLDRVWGDGAGRRLTMTDAIQPVSNALYARRADPGNARVPARRRTARGRAAGSGACRTRPGLAAGARPRRVRLRPGAGPRPLAADGAAHVFAPGSAAPIVEAALGAGLRIVGLPGPCCCRGRTGRPMRSSWRVLRSSNGGVHCRECAWRSGSSSSCSSS